MSDKLTNSPQIRFAGFTDAWEQRKLGDLVSIKSGWSPSNFIESYDQNSSLFIKVDDLNYSSREQIESHMKVQANPRFIKMKKGSTIFPKRGAAIMTNKVRILGSAGYMDTNMMALEPESIDGEFLYTSIERTGLYKIADTSTIPQINNKHIEPYVICLPGKDEQEKVGEFFKNLDHLITLHQRELELLKDTKKSLLQKMFPKDGANVPEIRFAGFTDAWEQCKLSDITDSIGTGKSSFIKHEKSDDNPYAILGSTSIIGYDSEFDHEGDFILTARVGANAGNLYRYYGKAKITDNTVFIKGENLSFLYLLLNHFDLKKLSFGTGQPLVKASELKNLQMKAPSFEEQTQIGNFFNQLDNLITLHQRELNSLKNLKKSLLQQMFV